MSDRKKKNSAALLAQWDRQYIWHPFTQMRDWLKSEAMVIVSGRGAILRDARGREYLDANSSIWTNLHGHAHPKINVAVKSQLNKIAHSSALGLASVPATLLAKELLTLANPPLPRAQPALKKVFFSDDGSTAMEAALKPQVLASLAGERRIVEIVRADGMPIADGWTAHACVDAKTFRPTRIPDWLADAIRTAEA